MVCKPTHQRAASASEPSTSERGACLLVCFAYAKTFTAADHVFATSSFQIPRFALSAQIFIPMCSHFARVLSILLIFPLTCTGKVALKISKKLEACHSPALVCQTVIAVESYLQGRSIQSHWRSSRNWAKEGARVVPYLRSHASAPYRNSGSCRANHIP
jgi:hypothetical protein